MLRASRGTLQTQATMFCICVEGLLQVVADDEPVTTQRDRRQTAEVRCWRKRLLKHLRVNGCPASRVKRFDQVTGRMLQLGQREVLARLVAMGAIDRDLEARWAKIRNPGAHADREGQG
jgi:hypothetical protein